MNEINEGTRILRAQVRDAVSLLRQDSSQVAGYVQSIVGPTFGDVLSNLATLIDERHRVGDGNGQKPIQVVHYTSISTIFSILSDAVSKVRKDSEPDQPPPQPDKLGAYLRLYDSAHFNDPDEGNHLIHAFNTNHQYDWLTEHGGSHAYIASFIPSEDKKDTGDDLVLLAYVR